jgi:hypothetical protein
MHYKTEVLEAPDESGEFRVLTRIGSSASSNVVPNQPMVQKKVDNNYFVPEIYHKSNRDLGGFTSEQRFLVGENTVLPENQRNQITKNSFLKSLKGNIYQNMLGGCSLPESVRDDFVSWLFGTSFYEWKTGDFYGTKVCTTLTPKAAECSEESHECKEIKSTIQGCENEGEFFPAKTCAYYCYDNPEYKSCLQNGGVKTSKPVYGATKAYHPENIAIDYNNQKTFEEYSPISYYTTPDRPATASFRYDPRYINQNINIVEWWRMRLQDCSERNGTVRLKISDIKIEYQYN